jgi:hypothetical protein
MLRIDTMDNPGRKWRIVRCRWCGNLKENVEMLRIAGSVSGYGPT